MAVREGEHTSRSMFPNMRFPILSLSITMMREILRPTPLDNTLSRRPRHSNLISKATRLSQDQHIQRIIQVLVIDNWVLRRILRR